MRNIKFKKINPYIHYFYLIPLSILGIYLIFYAPLHIKIERFNSRLYGLIPLAIAYLISNDFFLPVNKVKYNDEILSIKINSSAPQTIKIAEISSYELRTEEIEIFLVSGKSLKLSLEKINTESKNLLVTFLTPYCNKRAPTA